MTQRVGHLEKMAVQAADPVQYSLVLKNNNVIEPDLPIVNTLLGTNLTLHSTGKINCIACNRSITKTYQQGYCFPCARKLARCDMCILRPENCHFHKGTCREPGWGLANCFIPHVVYLANNSGLKVGLTRETNIPMRWIDQGAVQSLAIMRVQSRFQAGLLESAFAKHIADKTDWRKMLRGISVDIDLPAARNDLLQRCAASIQQIAGKFKFGEIEILTAEPINSFNYPVLQYPERVTTLNFDKIPEINGTLFGIKGQYLLFDCGVINLRKYTGYEIRVSY